MRLFSLPERTRKPLAKAASIMGALALAGGGAVFAPSLVANADPEPTHTVTVNPTSVNGVNQAFTITVTDNSPNADPEDEYFISGIPSTAWTVDNATVISTQDGEGTLPLYQVSGPTLRAGVNVTPPAGWTGELEIQVLKPDLTKNLLRDFDNGTFDYIGTALPDLGASMPNYELHDPRTFDKGQWAPHDGYYSVWPTALMTGPDGQPGSDETWNNRWADLRSVEKPLSIEEFSSWRLWGATEADPEPLTPEQINGWFVPDNPARQPLGVTTADGNMGNDDTLANSGKILVVNGEKPEVLTTTIDTSGGDLYLFKGYFANVLYDPTTNPVALGFWANGVNIGQSPADSFQNGWDNTSATWTRVGSYVANPGDTLTLEVRNAGKVGQGNDFALDNLGVYPATPVSATFRAIDWSLVKNSDPVSGTPVNPGDVVTYSVTATNNSDSDPASPAKPITLSGAVAVDELSDVLNNAEWLDELSDPVNAKLEGTTLSWNIPDLAPGESTTLTYKVKVNADTDKNDVTLHNVVTPGDSDEVPPPSDCDVDGCRETEHPVPGFTVDKTSNPASGSAVAAGSTIEYTVTATNTGATALNPVDITDDMSAVLNHGTYNGDAAASIGVASATTPTVEGTTLSWSGVLQSQEVLTLTYSITLDEDASGVIVNNHVSGEGTPVDPNEPPEPVDPIKPPPVETEHSTAKWTLVKDSDPVSGSTVKPGESITYTVTATNLTDVVVKDAIVSDDLSDVLDNATLVGDPVPSTGTAAVDEDGKLTWNIPELTNEAAATLTYTVKVKDDAKGVTLRNVVTSEGNIPPEDCEEDGCRETEHPTPKWTLVKDSDPAKGSTVVPGQEITYTLTAVNESEAEVKDAVATDDLTDVLKYADLVDVPNGLSLNGKTLTWNIGTLNAGQTKDISYTVKVKDDARGVTLRNVVTGDGSVPPEDCEVGGCRETEHPTPKWTLVKDSDPAKGSTVLPGQEVTYTVTATNTSDAMLESAVVTDNLADVFSNATLVGDPVASTGVATVEDSELTWNISALAKGQSATLTYTVKINDGAYGVTIANVVTGEGDVPPEDCEVDGCRETEHPTPQWSLEKSSNPKSGSTVKAGQVVTYTLTATNTSDAVVEGAKATDDLSKVLSGATLVTPLDESLKVSGSTLEWSVPTLKPGESAKVSYKVKVHEITKDIKLVNLVAPTTPGGECLPDKCTTEHPGIPSLPNTGASIAVPAALGALLLLVGGLGIGYANRRRNA